VYVSVRVCNGVCRGQLWAESTQMWFCKKFAPKFGLHLFFECKTVNVCSIIKKKIDCETLQFWSSKPSLANPPPRKHPAYATVRVFVCVCVCMYTLLVSTGLLLHRCVYMNNEINTNGVHPLPFLPHPTSSSLLRTDECIVCTLVYDTNRPENPYMRSEDESWPSI